MAAKESPSVASFNGSGRKPAELSKAESGSRGKVLKNAKSTADRQRKLKLTKAIKQLKSDDKAKDIDARMDSHADQIKRDS